MRQARVVDGNTDGAIYLELAVCDEAGSRGPRDSGGESEQGGHAQRERGKRATGKAPTQITNYRGKDAT